MSEHTSTGFFSSPSSTRSVNTNQHASNVNYNRGAEPRQQNAVGLVGKINSWGRDMFSSLSRGDALFSQPKKNVDDVSATKKPQQQASLTLDLTDDDDLGFVHIAPSSSSSSNAQPHQRHNLNSNCQNVTPTTTSRRNSNVIKQQQQQLQQFQQRNHVVQQEFPQQSQQHARQQQPQQRNHVAQQELSQEHLRQNIQQQQQQQKELGVKGDKFIQFYHSYKQQSLKNRMNQIKQQLENPDSPPPSDSMVLDSPSSTVPLTTSAFFKSSIQSPTTPSTSSSLVTPTQQAFSGIEDSVHKLDAITEEIMNERNYQVMVHKLHTMDINPPPYAPPSKKPKTSIPSSTSTTTTTSSSTPDSMQEDNTVLAVAVAAPPQPKVVSLKSLCIGVCVQWSEYLPSIPEGCFEDGVVWELVNRYVRQGRSKEGGLENGGWERLLEKVLNEMMSSVEIRKCDALTPAIFTLLSNKLNSVNSIILPKSICHDRFVQNSNITNTNINTNQRMVHASKSIFQIELLVSSVMRLEHLNLSHCYQLTNDQLLLLYPHLSSLVSLNLSHCPLLSDASIHPLLSPPSPPPLQSLLLNSCILLTDLSFSSISSLPCLSTFEIRSLSRIGDNTCKELAKIKTLRKVAMGSRNVTGTGIKAMINGCPQLRELEIGEADNISEEDIINIFIGLRDLEAISLLNCKNLNNLNISNELNLSKIGKNYNMKKLDLSRAINFGDEGLIMVLNSFPNLKELNLSFCEEITDYSWESYFNQNSNASNYNYLNQVEYLNVEGCIRLSEKTIIKIIQKIGNNNRLKYLNLNNVKSVSDQVLECISNTTCNDSLKGLEIALCDSISKSGMTQFLNRKKNLKQLNVSDLDLGMDIFFNNNEMDNNMIFKRNIKKLNLGHWKSITDEGLYMLVTQCPFITHLDLSYCPNLSFTNPKLHGIFGLLPNLKHLNLRGILSISSLNNGSAAQHSSGFLFGGRKMVELKSLNLSFCKGVGDDIIEEIGESCGGLEKLDLAYCGKVSGGGVHKLGVRLGFLRVLNLRGCSLVPFLVAQFLISSGRTVLR
eukprot:TRINITY_DN2555_c0_g2_i1.p1 TRINITY_DN2555_c0_g2~~TRINITY_DN2555_c0_g2_i1.p1  ORF type:complete len:1051 (-),score=288.39 TRINITY_DN2555_c0_g2_i1:77-3229(-)